MTTYRLHNNIFECCSAYLDFRAIRKQCDGLKVGFAENNESLLDKLKSDWVPVGLDFKSDLKKAAMPDISIWNMSCLVLNQKAMDALQPLLKGKGELLTLQNSYYLFNCLESLSGDVVDAEKSSFEIESVDTAHIPKKLELIESKIKGKPVFKPGFAENSFLIVQDDFKSVVNENKLTGLLLQEDLENIFPEKPTKVDR